jgi:hypothetical protein
MQQWYLQCKGNLQCNNVTYNVRIQLTMQQCYLQCKDVNLQCKDSTYNATMFLTMQGSNLQCDNATYNVTIQWCNLQMQEFNYNEHIGVDIHAQWHMHLKTTQLDRHIYTKYVSMIFCCNPTPSNLCTMHV